MKKRTFSILLSMVLGIAALTGCGFGQSGGNPETVKTTEPAKATDAAEDTEAVKATEAVNETGAAEDTEARKETEAANKTEDANDTGASNAKDAEADGLIYYIGKCADSTYWQTVQAGAEAAMKEEGCNLKCLNPNTEAEIDKQITMVEEAVNSKADVIVLAPLDVTALIEPCKAAMAAGTKVILVDSMIESEDYDVAYATNNITGGAMCADEMAKVLDNKGKVFIINTVPGSGSVIQRQQGFLDQMAEKYPEIEVVNKDDVLYCNNDPTTAAQQAKDTIAANPDIDAIYTPAEKATFGVAQGLKEVGKDGEVLVIGFDSNEDLIALLGEGAVHSLTLQDPYNMGYMGVKGAVKMLGGEELEHEVVDTGCIIATKENMDTEEIQNLFYPLGK